MSRYNAELVEIKKRLEMVRQAKIRKALKGEPPQLSPAELDAILPPADCLRSRLRARGITYRQYCRERAS